MNEQKLMPRTGKESKIAPIMKSWKRLFYRYRFPTRIVIVGIAVALMISLTALQRPAAQSLTPTPSQPVATIIPNMPIREPTPSPEPGDTTSLMVMSAVLVLIIVTGVVMGNALTKVRKKGKPNE